MKFREAFRPFCPSLLWERKEEYLEHAREAIRCFYDNGLDVLALGSFVLEKKGCRGPGLQRFILWRAWRCKRLKISEPSIPATNTHAFA